eukprot:CAMPEP_0115061470 /NCGR_PEP_ID=MMETSP0227-20121206/8024_1 /TAXON_ID=89957 /ORGANISM="Polarella glacialis, Strain CCMP 1383" /LENGTH=360 /DNA_ID=CAMNT_0002446773 /DNA_START=43 /DNA_END=1125 /DNA_ORIENTATION=-
MRRLVLGSAIAGAAMAETSDPLQFMPHYQNLTFLAKNFPDHVMAEIRASPLRAVAPTVGMPEEALTASGTTTLPTVTAHGMGDSCWEPGMISIARGIGKKTGTYARCVPTAGNVIADTIDGFLKDMDSSVDYFARKIRADPKLAGGFNAIGFSQGNSLIRGYIQKYNDPPVNAFVSVHGTVMGVSALPSCFEQEKPLGLICKSIAEVLGNLAYLPIAQRLLFQADYYRAPKKVSGEAYLRHSQLANWNNEDTTNSNATYAANFAKVKKFGMVKAMQDSMVYPNDGEWWGAMDDETYDKVLPMNETKFYKNDLFGLRTADEAGKLHFESTAGGHLDFTDAELYGWVEKYFMTEAQSETIVV